jgi:antitoxin component of MazEF toxin-antitoxin module
MPLETATGRAAARVPGVGVALALTAALLVSGCASGFFTEPPPPPPKPVIDHKATSSAALADDFTVLQKLITAPPQQQMQIVGSAEEDFQTAPTPSRKLRLALILGTPGQAGSDLPRAQQMLQELSADPQPSLLAGERSLVTLELKQIGDYLTLERENRTLQADAARAGQLATLKHRLDGATEENEKLKRQLGEAQAKLAAIANIEKSLNER